MRNSMRTRASGQGFSLIEVMIVVLIMGIVTAQIFVVLTSQRRTFMVNEQALNTQETARVVSDLISFDARMAGFMVPLNAGVSSVDGGPVNADRVCISDPSFALTPLDGTPSPTMDNMGRKFGGVTATNSSGTLTAVSSFDVDGDGTNDFAGNGGVIITDGVRTFCDRIVWGGIAGTTIDLSDTTPGAMGAAVTIVPAIVYEVGNLTENNGAITTSTTLSRNGIPLSNSVEDLQVRYWVDSEIPDGVMAGAEWPIDDLNNGAPWMDLTRVRRMQISIVSVGTQGERQEGQFFNRRRRPGMANRAPGVVFDEIPRRAFTVDVLPRNLL